MPNEQPDHRPGGQGSQSPLKVDCVKTFRYPKGHDAGTTMTVAELREKLNEFPQDMPVLAEWEGTWNFIDANRFQVELYDHGHPDDMCEVLIIDAENH